MSKHTRGPWNNNNGVSVWAKNVARTTVCIAKLPPDCGLAERAANARLIAAAPELYEACRMLLDDPGITAPANDVIRAAIAKAEGR